MQAVTVALFAVLAVASAGLIGVSPVVHTVHAAPVVHTVHAAPAVQVYHAAPVVKTIVPVAQSSSFSYRAPAAKLAVPVVHAAPVLHSVHAVPTVIRTAPVIAHGPVLVH